jgi:hypothetical protein
VVVLFPEKEVSACLVPFSEREILVFQQVFSWVVLVCVVVVFPKKQVLVQG